MADLEKQELIYEISYYYMGQISRFVPPNSYRIFSEESSNLLSSVAFLTPELQIVVIAMNQGEEAVLTKISYPGKGYARYEIPARSIVTFTFHN
jgi:glucosylceramidase